MAGLLQRTGVLLSLAAVAGFGWPAAAQQADPPPIASYNQSPDRPAPSQASKDGLDPAPLAFELLGMRFRPPAGAIMRSEGTGPTATWILSERADPPRFILRISRLVADDAASSPRAQIDAYVRSVSERPSPNAVFSVKSRKEFELGGRPAGLLYTALREGTGEDEVSAVQGYFLLQVSPKEFVVVSSLLAEADYATVPALLERSFRTMEILPEDQLAAERVARMARGEHLLDGLDEEALRRALDPAPKDGTLPAPRWYRISRVDPAGEAQEVGYMTLTVIDGAQGAANPDRKEQAWSSEEKERGLLARVQLRTLLDPKGESVSDTDGRYWVRWDRAREFWTVRTTLRKGRLTKSSAQLGIRTAPKPGSPRPMLEVTEVSQTTAGGEPRRWALPERGYLSQAEALLLPRLLPRADAPTAYGFYWYDSRSGRLAQRVDLKRALPDGAEIGTRQTLESPVIDERVDARGILVRRASDDGSVVELTTGEALLALWRKKGLPTQ